MPGQPPVHADLGKLGMLAGLVALFFVGGVAGAAGYLALGFPVLIAPALVLLVVAAAPGRRPAGALTRPRRRGMKLRPWQPPRGAAARGRVQEAGVRPGPSAVRSGRLRDRRDVELEP